MARNHKLARTYLAIAVVPLIADGRFKESEAEEAAQRSVELRDAFVAIADEEGITDSATLQLALRNLATAVKQKGDAARAARYAIRCAKLSVEKCDAISGDGAPASGEDIEIA